MGGPDVLRLATYNVWFGEWGFVERARALLKLLEDENADVIALQEVTPEFLEILDEFEWVRAYARSVSTSVEVEPYGTLILSRAPVREFERIRLWSYQGRTLSIARLEHEFEVATVHLESKRGNAEIRETQLHDIFPVLKARHTVLMGDFNFDPTWPEQASIPTAYTDVWRATRGGSEGFTVDTDLNEMTAAAKGKLKQVRFDRILMKSPEYRPVRASLLGTRALRARPELWPSDHFGLSADVQRTETAGPEAASGRR